MIFNSAQIEAITQDVLRELKSRGVVVAAAAPSKSKSKSAGATGDVSAKKRSQRTEDSVVELNQKVLTEASLSAANVGGGTVRVPADAVVTPSGRDFIRRHGIRLTSATSVSSAAGVRASLVLAGDCSAASSAAASVGWDVVKAGCDPDAAYQTRQLLPHPVVTCSRQPAVVACLLNRDPAVRAAVVDSAVSLTGLQSAMNPQVLCVSPQSWSFAGFRRLFDALKNASVAAPDSWKEL